jgi:hypothetical protein
MLFKTESEDRFQAPLTTANFKKLLNHGFDGTHPVPTIQITPRISATVGYDGQAKFVRKSA